MSNFQDFIYTIPRKVCLHPCCYVESLHIIDLHIQISTIQSSRYHFDIIFYLELGRWIIGKCYNCSLLQTCLIILIDFCAI